MGLKEEVGERIKQMRKQRQMRQEDLAQLINQSAGSIAMYESGRRAPDFETLSKIAKVFHVQIGSMFPVIEFDSIEEECITGPNDDNARSSIPMPNCSIYVNNNMQVIRISQKHDYLLTQAQKLSPRKLDALIHVVDSMVDLE